MFLLIDYARTSKLACNVNVKRGKVWAKTESV